MFLICSIFNVQKKSKMDLQSLTLRLLCKILQSLKSFVRFLFVSLEVRNLQTD